MGKWLSRWIEERVEDDMFYLLRLVRAYRNWPRVVTRVILGDYPYVGRPRIGGEYTVSDRQHSRNLAVIADKGWAYDAVRGAVFAHCPRLGQWVMLYGADRDGAAGEVFGGDGYGDLEVEGRDVLDVGANIGDSAVYFALRGARRVLAVEPYPVPAAIALRNVQANGVSGVVTVLAAACSADDGVSTIDPTQRATGGRCFSPAPGVEVETFSLHSLAHQLEPGAALKMDCEGAEYGILAAADDATLLRFTQIILEYHDGAQGLPDRLRGLGYAVDVSKPRGQIGLLFAHRGEGQ